jgi:hypothetical protein
MSTQIINGLFQSIPPTKVEKGFLDHCEAYVSTTDGARDLYDLISHCSKGWEIWGDCNPCAVQVKEVFELAGLTLSVPQLICDLSALNRGITRLFASSCEHTMQTARTIKDVVMQSLLLINTGARSISFAQGMKCLALTSRQIVQVSLIATVTSLITDGSDLIRDCIEWQVEGKSEEADNLAFMNVMKNLSSVAVSVLLLVSSTFGALLSEPVLTGALFALGTIYLVSKISAYFYKEMVIVPSHG